MTKLLFREFSEEIFLIDRHPSEKRVFQKLFFHPDRSDNEYISHEFTKVQRELRSRQDGISIALSGSGNEVEIETVRSRMEVSVNEIYTRNISISVNPKEMGIEAVKIVKFDLEQSDYILDGEFSENDSPFLIRRPAMLLSFSKKPI